MAKRFIQSGSLAFSALSGIALAGSQLYCSRLPVPRLLEKFDPALSDHRQVEAIAASLGTGSELEYADRADEFLRRRFFHAYSYYRPCDNWLAFAAGYLWDDLRSPVIASDILQRRRAACSQQAIVFQALLRERGITYASVGLPGHFMAAAKIDGRWLVYDANVEIPVRRYPLDRLMAGDPQVAKLYPEFPIREAAAKGQIKFHSVNSNPAPRATLFHRVTRFLSLWLWALSLLAFAVLRFARR